VVAKYLADHCAGECLYPLPVADDPPDRDMSRQLFCCEPVEAKGERYCRTHNQISYPGRRR
jgi:hypothetical protein